MPPDGMNMCFRCKHKPYAKNTACNNTSVHFSLNQSVNKQSDIVTYIYMYLVHPRKLSPNTTHLKKKKSIKRIRMHLYTVTKCRNRYDRCHCQLAINPWQIYSGSIVKIVKGKSYVKKKKEYLAPSILLHPLTTTSTVAFPLLSLSHPLFDINLLQVALIFTVPMALRLWSLYLRCHGHNSMTLRF